MKSSQLNIHENFEREIIWFCSLWRETPTRDNYSNEKSDIFLNWTAQLAIAYVVRGKIMFSQVFVCDSVQGRGGRGEILSCSVPAQGEDTSCPNIAWGRLCPVLILQGGGGGTLTRCPYSPPSTPIPHPS